MCATPVVDPNTNYAGNLNDMEKQMIFQAMAQAGGSQAKAAQQLGISTRTLRRKLVKYRREDEGSSNIQSGNSSQQQRYYRATIEIPLTMLVDGQEVVAKTVNISSGGLAIQSPMGLTHGASMDCSFTLPGNSNPIEAKMKLAWTGPEGLAGLSIVEIHPALQRELQQWLLDRASEEIPAEKAAAAGAG